MTRALLPSRVLQRAASAIFIGAVTGVSSATAATQTWSGTNSGIWDVSALNWDSGTAAWTNSNDALFSGTPTNSVTTATGLLIGSITLDNTFTGSVAMTGANTVSGATTISGGTLNLNAATGLGTSAITVDIGGTLAINPGTGTSTVANNISGAGMLTAQAPGGAKTNTLVLSGNYGGFTGTLNILAGASNFGKLNFSNTNQANTMSSGTVQIQSGATLYLNQALTYGFNTELFGDGNAENLGALRVDNGAIVSGGVTLRANSQIGSNGATGTISGVISESGGSFGVTKMGNQTLALTGVNTYTGGTTVNAGTLSVGGNGALGTGTVVMNGGNLSNTTGVTIANSITLNKASTFTAGNGAMVLSSNITGAPAGSWTLVPTNKITLAGTNSPIMSLNFGGMLVNAGAGGVDITGATTIEGAAGNTFSGYIGLIGTTTVTIQSGGSLTVNGTSNASKPDSGIGNNAAGTSTLLVNGGALTFGGEQGIMLGNNRADATGVLTISSGTATLIAGSTTATDIRNFVAMGRDGGNGIVNLDGGTLATSRRFVRDGHAGGTAGPGTANFNFNGGTLQAQADQITGNGWFETSTTGDYQIVTTNVKDGGAIIDTNGFTVNINTALVHAGSNAIDGGLVKNGAGTLSLGGTNTFTGNAVVTAGTLSLATNVSLDDTITLSLASGTTLDMAFSGIETINGLILNGSVVAAGTYDLTQLNILGSGSVSFTSSTSSGGTLTVLSAVPEPGTVALVSLGLLFGLFAFRRSKVPTLS